MIFSLFIMAILSVLWIGYDHDNNVAERALVKEAGIREYIIKCKYLDSHQSFLEVYVSNIDKQKLMERFQFDNNLSKLLGQVQPSFTTENQNYLYYVTKKDRGPYGYMLVCLEKNGNSLIRYTWYGG